MEIRNLTHNLLVVWVAKLLYSLAFSLDKSSNILIITQAQASLTINKSAEKRVLDCLNPHTMQLDELTKCIILSASVMSDIDERTMVIKS